MYFTECISEEAKNVSSANFLFSVLGNTSPPELWIKNEKHETSHPHSNLTITNIKITMERIPITSRRHT